MAGDGDNLSAHAWTGNRRRSIAGIVEYVRAHVHAWWPYLKTAVGLAVVAIVGYHFAQDLMDPRLWQRSLRPGWVVLAGVLYLSGVLFSALAWRRLIELCGFRPRLYPTARAFYLGQLGRYLPGKAWAMFLRADMLRDERVPVGLGVVTAFYEVFITMTGAALPAVVLFALFAPHTACEPHGEILHDMLRLHVPPDVDPGRRTAVLLSLTLLLVVGVPSLPPVFNRIARRIASTFASADGLPRFNWKYLAEGLALTCTGWLILGLSLASALYAVVGRAIAWSPHEVGYIVAILGASYVAGFIVVVAPSGLGVREYFLALFLAPLLRDGGIAADEARGLAILTALVLRVAWTGAEMALAGVLWRLQPARVRAKTVS